ncbi:hypothetical protein [Sporosarcina cyprini]|uniref:hypothetical protein n=1 Tax=Sporosarcina cyprini TaxID=2910523 RepID=UPI001EDFA5F8|nr:hypothetical protein [Sporosarcina cyprini]MCG3087209.1 hypothetical protein [Sporosarcina cyprini]
MVCGKNGGCGGRVVDSENQQLYYPTGNDFRIIGRFKGVDLAYLTPTQDCGEVAALLNCSQSRRNGCY